MISIPTIDSSVECCGNIMGLIGMSLIGRGLEHWGIAVFIALCGRADCPAVAGFRISLPSAVTPQDILHGGYPEDL